MIKSIQQFEESSTKNLEKIIESFMKETLRIWNPLFMGSAMK